MLEPMHGLLRSMAIAALALALAAPGAAARRSVPPGFFGMNWDDEIAAPSAPSVLQDQQFGRMAAAGLSMSVCLLIVTLGPVVTVVGYELLGHRHAAEAISRSLSNGA